MKSIYKSFFILISLCALFSSCREGIVEPTRLLELHVVDTLGEPIPDAKVEIYLYESELNLEEETAIETLYTDEEGILNVALDPEIFDYYINIEKGELSNWYTNTFINLTSRGVNVITVTLNNSFEAALTGKYRKRWQQTAEILNGNPFLPSCFNQLYHEFIRRPEESKEERSGQIEKFQSDVCAFPGKYEGFNIWTYNKQNNTITFGTDNFAETFTVAEFTGDKLVLIGKTVGGVFTKEKRYKLVD